MKKPELIFIPAPGVGHVISALEFAARLLGHDPRVSITVLAMKAPFSPHLDAYTKSLVASQPRIALVDLPPVDPPPPELLRSVEHYITVYIESYIPHVQRAVGEIQRSLSDSGSDRTVAGFVLDLFCTSMIDVADGFSLPSYIYLTCNASFLSLMFYLPARHDEVGREVRPSDPALPLSGFTNPVPVSVLPGAVLDGEAGGHAAYLKLARRFRDARGIMVNTFKELEPFAIGSLASGGSSDGPAVYAVGPVIDLKGVPHPSLDRAHWEKIREWLDKQPPSSVVFLCFGSLGSFDADQVKEIAAGIERSGHKFVWSLRPESSQSQLPDGFLERTQGRGVVCGWAPQVEVLAHAAIGGFVSHCGWNSILESLWHGVPIVTWPIYAEQQLNAFMMVKELGLAVELRLDYRGQGVGSHLVPAEEIERAIGRLMGDGSTAMRMKVEEMREAARNAVKEGGSSFDSIGSLIQDFVKSIE